MQTASYLVYCLLFWLGNTVTAAIIKTSRWNPPGLCQEEILCCCFCCWLPSPLDSDHLVLLREKPDCDHLEQRDLICCRVIIKPFFRRPDCDHLEQRDVICCKVIIQLFFRKSDCDHLEQRDLICCCKVIIQSFFRRHTDCDPISCKIAVTCGCTYWTLFMVLRELALSTQEHTSFTEWNK